MIQITHDFYNFKISLISPVLKCIMQLYQLFCPVLSGEAGELLPLGNSLRLSWRGQGNINFWYRFFFLYDQLTKICVTKWSVLTIFYTGGAKFQQ